MVHFRTAQFAAIGAAACLVVSAFVATLAFTTLSVSSYPSFSEEHYPPNLYPAGRLECSYLDEVWEWRRAFFPSQISIDFFLGVGLIMIIHPINALRKVYSHSAVRSILSNAMAYSFFVGVALNGLELLENFGTEATGLLLTFTPMTCQDREALEISYNLGESMSVWIFSLDYLFLAVAFGMSAFLSLRYNIISKWHGVLGAFNGVLCLAAFSLELAQVAHGEVYYVFGAVTLFLFGGGFPAWLVWLALIMGSDSFQLVAESAPKEQRLESPSAEVPSNETL